MTFAHLFIILWMGDARAELAECAEGKNIKAGIAISAVRLIRDDGWGLQGGESRFVDTLQHWNLV